MNFTIAEELKKLCPGLELYAMAFDLGPLVNQTALKQAFEVEKEWVLKTYSEKPISEVPTIAAARKLYRQLGKDPTRYRISSESLIRRITLSKGLEQVNPVVDCLNMASMHYGLSIGGYDSTAIKGDLILDIGTETDVYNAVGRGPLNVTGIPVLKDEIGAFGSATTDSDRAKIHENSREVLMNIISFNGDQLLQTADMLEHLLVNHLSAKVIKTWHVT